MRQQISWSIWFFMAETIASWNYDLKRIEQKTIWNFLEQSRSNIWTLIIFLCYQGKLCLIGHLHTHNWQFDVKTLIFFIEPDKASSLVLFDSYLKYWSTTEYVNHINHEPCVWFQVLKLFWNPHTISKPFYQISFMIRGIFKNLNFHF